MIILIKYEAAKKYEAPRKIEQGRGKMKKIISITIILIAFTFIFAACNTFERCPAYTDVTVESTHCDKV